ncbi:MAG: hypothetical protein IK004_00685 [Bacteroidales bacterium]|nr:hypothetical protein [Bacteroidales bacterium]
MDYIAQCQICREKINNNCKKEQSYDGTRCPKFRDFNRFGHMSSVLKFIFAIYIGISAALSVLSFYAYLTITPYIPTVISTVTLIVQGFIVLYMIYAVVAFMKPLPDGAFILKMLIIMSLVIGFLVIIAGFVLGQIFSVSLLGIFAVLLAIVCLLFLKRDDELDYLFPKEKRKVFVWDYIFIALQILSIVVSGLSLLG